jgi:DNA-directed RNA polymerase subunit RPC12/RpoP
MIDITKYKLNDLYWKKDLSMSKIGKLFNCSVSSISRIMRKYGIKRRGSSEATKILNTKGSSNNNYIDGRSLKKYYCIDCGKKIAWTTWFYGTKRCFDCSSKERSRSKIVTGKNSPTYKHGKPKCVDCGKQLTCYTNERCRDCYKKDLSKSRMGRGNPMYGKPTPYSKRLYYNGVCMRSTWETNFAKFLSLSGINWEYEKHRFNLGECTYTPDFYLPEFDCYIEIKGWWRDESLKRFNLFIKKYKDIKITVLMREQLVELGILK